MAQDVDVDFLVAVGPGAVGGDAVVPPVSTVYGRRTQRAQAQHEALCSHMRMSKLAKEARVAKAQQEEDNRLANMRSTQVACAKNVIRLVNYLALLTRPASIQSSVPAPIPCLKVCLACLLLLP